MPGSAPCTGGFGLLALAVFTASGSSCGALESPSDTENEAPASEEAAGQDDDAGPSGMDEAMERYAASQTLTRVMDKAVHPPPPGGSTYYVDPFVAAFVLEAVRTGVIELEPTEEDSATGFRLAHMPESLGPLGLRQGDIIETLDGTELSTAEQATEALAGAQNRIRLTIFRDGMSSTLSYRLLGGMAWAKTLGTLGHPQRPGQALAAAEPEAFAEVVGEGEASQSEPAVPKPPSTTKREPVARPSPSPKPSSRGRNKLPRDAPEDRSPRRKRPTPTPPATDQVRCTDARSCEIDKPLFDSMVRNPERLDRYAEVVPAIRNNIHSGYKLKRIRPGSPVDELGFRNGDKITHINGHYLADDASAMSLYMQLGATRVFNIRYQRGGRTRTKRVDVR